MRFAFIYLTKAATEAWTDPDTDPPPQLHSVQEFNTPVEARSSAETLMTDGILWVEVFHLQDGNHLERVLTNKWTK